MKTIAIVAFILLSLSAAPPAWSQCNMGGGSQHKHGDAQQSEHPDATPATKGYAFINDDGIQEATVTIKDGYQPGVLVLKKGIPLRINFDLQEDGCTGTVVMKDFDIKEKLVPYVLNALEFTPDTSGSFTFACPMHMIEGTLIVKE